ncbi:MAG: anti-sigma factor ChrR (cupin superfamily) [Verrucomicrobiales bacterium]|jgi:anti-sigma factor ChrR (cupin superfamily)
MSDEVSTPEDQRAEMAVLHALGALDGESLGQVAHCIGCPGSDMSRAVEELDVMVAAMSQALLPSMAPPADAKAEIDRLLGFTVTADEEDSIKPEAFTYVMSEEGEWRPLPVLKGGARVKELSNDAASGFTVMLLELDAGTRFPSHSHHGIEETFLISGDLQMQDRVLGPGDFARALPGTRHSSLYSENGCRALIVTAAENYPEKAVHAYGSLYKALGKARKIFGGEPGSN